MGTEASSPEFPRAGGPMVEFYLGKGIRGVTSNAQREQFVPVSINGYPPTMLKMGARNRVPKDLYDVLMNSRSRTVVLDVEKAARNPRPATAYGAPGRDQLKVEELMDYEIEFIKEDK